MLASPRTFQRIVPRWPGPLGAKAGSNEWTSASESGAKCSDQGWLKRPKHFEFPCRHCALGLTLAKTIDLDLVLAAARGRIEAAAGCGKTESIVQLVTAAIGRRT